MKNDSMLKGIIPPMITPLNKDRSVDLDSTKKLVNYLIEGGVHTLFALGTTGEGPLIPIEEQVKFAKTVVEETNSRVPVIAGVSAASTTKVLKNINALASTGVDAFVSTLPFYDNSNTQEQINHFKILADKSDLPIIIYDISAKVGQSLDKKAIKELVSNENIVGLKDSSSNIRRFRELIEEFNEIENFDFALGHSDMIDISIYLGAVGTVPSDAHLFPELCVDIYKKAKEENWDAAKALQKDLNEKRIELYSKYAENNRANQKICKIWLKDKNIIAHDEVMDPYFS